MRKTRLPDFLIIAAPKAGTTSLDHELQAHPQVWMPRLKAPNWFVFDGPETPRFGGPHDGIRRREMIESWDAYRAMFTECPPEKVCGEASIRYVYSSQARQAIRRRIPDVRLIALLRQPADRAYSAYQRDRSHGLEPCATFAKAIADGPRREREGWRRGANQSLGCHARALLGALAPWLETMAPNLRAQLTEAYRDDIHALSRLIGRNLDAWLP